MATDSAIRQETTRVSVETPATEAARNARLAALVGAQQPVLLALQARLDSLRASARAALPEVPAALAPATPDSVRLPVAVPVIALAPDSVQRPALAPKRRWAALLLTETTTRWGELPGPHPATTREQLLGATTHTVAVEYRVPTAAGAPGRWALRTGFGETRLRDQFRFAADTTHHILRHDTTWAFQTNSHFTHDSTYTVRLDSIARPEPIINQQGQIIGYTTAYVHYHDTTYHVTTKYYTDSSMQEQVHTRLETTSERRRQDLRPDYRFWSVPVAVQFEVLRRGRWSAGLSAGAQVLLFRGGYRAVHDGATGEYQLRRIGAREGPFRPVSLALSAGLDVRCRLTDRLAVLAGGAARGWAVGPLRTGTLPRWTWGAQAGVSWELGR